MERSFCPKCGYRRQPADTAPFDICPHCGIVFAKYAQHMADRAAGIPPPSGHSNTASMDEPGWRAWLTTRRGPVNRPQLVGEALLLAGLILWGGHFIACDWRTGEAGESFMHQVNLPIHEFGHVLFRPFGQWLMFLGGSLFQCLLPLILAVAFVIKERQPFGGAVCLWWVGQNLIDVAPYIGDARAMAMPLIGEWREEAVDMRYSRHDWHNILEPFGLLTWDHGLARLAHWSGATVILIAWAWAAAVLQQSWRDSKNPPAAD
jgi:hypothetical protein